MEGLLQRDLRMARIRPVGSESGFSLLEAVVATGLLAGGIVALGEMFAFSVADNTSSRTRTFAAVLAVQKLEQLRALTWTFDASGTPISDLTTNTALPEPSPAGGTGLSPSPGHSLTSSVDGYVDYVDRRGRIVGGGSSPPPGTLYVRRWSIERLPGNPDHTLILQVAVTIHRRGTAGANGSARPQREEARVMTIKTRRFQ
jgi:hypothetical protein